MVFDGEWRCMGETARFQEPLRWLAMIGEGFVEDQAGRVKCGERNSPASRVGCWALGLEVRW